MNFKPRQVIAQRFRLVRELGRGGVGAVWLAHQIALDVPCAIKFFIGAEADLAQYSKRFELEAKAAAKLQHPNVVRILDSGIWEGRPFIAMELLEGECLDARLRRRGRLLPHETIAFCNQVGSALAMAHGLGIVHRDLKPSNIFLAREHGHIVVKLIDFGIAKQSTKQSIFSAAPSPLTHSETIIGTPAYMSPEQIEGTRPLDGRSDLWALAVIVFECLTGQLPFHSTTIGDLFSRIMFKPIPVPSQVSSGLPLAFDAWWARASARDPAARFQSAAELCADLTRALSRTSVADADLMWMSSSGVGIAPLSLNHSSSSVPLAPSPNASNAGSVQPTLSGHARPRDLPQDRGRSRLLLAAVAGGFMVVGFVGVAWLVHGSGAPPPAAAPAAGGTPAEPSASLPSPAASSLAAPSAVATESAAVVPSATASAEPATTTSSRVKSKGPGKPGQKSEWGF